VERAWEEREGELCTGRGLHGGGKRTVEVLGMGRYLTPIECPWVSLACWEGTGVSEASVSPTLDKKERRLPYGLLHHMIWSTSGN
jgi:hypothetical protein